MLELKHRNEGKSAQGNRQVRACNLCGTRFKAASLYHRFCDGCREGSDLYRCHEWLPEAPPELWSQENELLTGPKAA